VNDLIDMLLTNPWYRTAVGVVVLLIGAVLAYVLVRRIVLPAMTRAVKASATQWDDILLDSRVLVRLTRLVPIIIVYAWLPSIPGVDGELADILTRFVGSVLVFSVALAVSSLLRAGNELYTTFPISRTRPIKGYVQIANILLFAVTFILAIATLAGRSPLVFLSGLTAMTAIILLVFRDTILAFVASIQVAQYDMVRIGDWIEMPQFGADGDVVDIALHTLRVQNWDKTITTIPVSALVNESFKNWRGMQQAGGRRIKRAIHLDMSTVRFLSDEEIDRYAKFQPISEYMNRKSAEIVDDATQTTVDSDLTTDPRRLTNVGTFRAYVWHYLKNHPQLDTEGMTFIVRQLQPGPEGLPLEVYVFSRETAWVDYENIQSDIFDHLLAMVPEFGLRVYQKPSGWDVKELGGKQSSG
jgi:miniconductance mechanosensitive channel